MQKTIAELARAIEPISPERLGDEVYSRFRGDDDCLAVAVVDGEGRPLGIVERNAFFLDMAKPYGRALYAGRPITHLMNARPLVADADTPALEFCQKTLLERPSELLAGFIVTKDGVYLGVGAALSLLQEAALATQRTERFLTAVVENVPVPLTVKGDDGRFLMLNRAAEGLFGVRREDYIGRSSEHLFRSASAAARYVELDREVLASGEARVLQDDVETPSNGLRRLNSVKLPVRNPGASDYVLTITEDVTDQRAQLKALEEATARAEAANVAKSVFLSNMSHEIRTPLNGVVGLADVLASTELDPSQREMLDAVRASSRTLERLLGDILDFARIEAGRLEIRPEPMQLGELARKAASLARPASGEKGLELVVSVAPETEGWVEGDELRLSQILNNLLSNAIKFTSSGSVSLGIRREAGDDHVIEVRDTGIGFEAGRKEAIFGRFQQADGSITRQFGGSGLGLAISRQLAEMMGGELDCTSAPGEGSTFTLRVPLKPCHAPRVEAPLLPAPAMGDDRPLRVLLADDHPTNRKVVELILMAIQADLVSVEDGQQAVEAFAAAEFDLVLMDMQMPVMDGLTALARIRELERAKGRMRTPAFMLTANAMGEHAEASLRAGADRHLAKPITSAALLVAIAALTPAAEDDPQVRKAG
jgi:PAS domain S-box-containing protein